jgi:hypothetical protein
MSWYLRLSSLLREATWKGASWAKGTTRAQNGGAAVPNG